MSSPPLRTEPATVSTSLSSTPTPTPALSSSVSNPTPTLTSTSTSTIPGNSTSTLTLTPTLSFARPASTSLGGRQHSNSNSNSNGNQTNNQHGLTIVLKIGSGSLSTSDSRFLNLTVICTLVETICRLQRQGHRVVLVSSGAVSIGCQRLGLTERPSNLITKQAVAAVGQSRLMRVYDDFFTHLAQPIAQVLLSRENLSKKHHYTNALNTFRELLRMGIVPIVNENDTVAVEELRFGDNDTLSALVASLVQADWLLLLTDVDALYTCDPRSNPSARPIHVVSSLDELRVELGGTSSWGTGGMTTKIQAARISTAAGVRTGIINSNKLENIEKLIAGHTDVGTQFTPAARPIRGKKKWIAHGVRPEGEIQLDSGAVRAILKKKSLFAAGITGCTGSFESHSCVILRDPSGIEIGRGIVNYSSSEVLALKGSSSTEYQQKLGYAGSDEIIHRENLAITASIQTQTTHHIDAQTAQQNLQLHDTEQDGDSDDTTLAQQQHEAAIAAANRLDPLETVMDALPLPSSTSSSSSISSRPRSTSPLPSPPPS